MKPSVHLHTPHGFGKSRMAAGLDKAIGVTNTARNWNTAIKLAELGRSAGKRGVVARVRTCT